MSHDFYFKGVSYRVIYTVEEQTKAITIDHQSYPGTRAAPARPAEGLPARTVLLVDVDSRLPNLALMKLAGYYKQRGYYIKLAKKEAYEPGVVQWAGSPAFVTNQKISALLFLNSARFDAG